MSRPLKWDKQVEEKFSLYLQQSSTIEKLSHLRQSLLRSSPNESAQKLTAFLTTAVDNCGHGENTNRRIKHSTRYRRERTKFPINSWFNDECKAQKRLVNEIKKMFLQQPNNTNLREQFFKGKKVYKKIIKARKRVAEMNFHKNLLTSQNNNPRDFWKTVKDLRKKDKHTETDVNPKEMMSHFQNLNMKRSSEQNEPPNAARVNIPDLDREISVTEVEEVLNKLKVNKAPGEDGIPPGVFKALDNTLTEMLAALFNNVMTSGEYPNCWSTGIICPIDKSGPRDDPNNYRGLL